VNELRKYVKRSTEIAKAMTNMINMHYVPCGLHTPHCMMTRDAEGKQTPDKPWHTLTGRPPIASLEEVQIIAEYLESGSGCGWCPGDVS
jgi:hypothetical protein